MDVDMFRLQPTTPLEARRSFAAPTPPRQKTEPFLRGPIPVWWLAKAAACGGAAVAAGLCLWFMRGVNKSNDPIKVTRSVRRRFALSGDQMRRGLHSLKAAGLVEFVTGGRGRCAVVSISCPEPQRGGDKPGPI
jgi:hypothetical protein